MNGISICIALLGLLLAGPAIAQVDTSIVPTEGRTTWAPGVTTGIPARATICATINASTYGNGSMDAAGAIRAAIVACPTGQTVLLSAGTFTANDYILIDKAVTLRGAGPGVTTIQKTNGATPGSLSPEEWEVIVVIGPSRYPTGWDDSTSVDLSADGTKGSMSVTVTSATGFEAGQFVLLDEDDYTHADWIPVPFRSGMDTGIEIWASDRIVFAKHNPPEGGDDPFPDSLTWFSRSGRPMTEIKEIASVVDNVVTFTTPLHAAYPMAKDAQLTRFNASTTPLQGGGLEDLTLTGGSDNNVTITASAYSWVKNIECTIWLLECVGVSASFRVELRDSHIHDAAWPYPGGGGYGMGLAWATSEMLIENNISSTANKVMVVKSAGAGSVVGYNYMDNGYIGNFLTWVEVGINGSHMVGPHHILFEGNQSNNYDSDDTHGNAFAMTIFRNHLTGQRRNFTDTQNVRAAGLMLGSWWHSFIGNVLGESGISGWVYENAYPWSGPSIYQFGYAPTHFEQAADPMVLSTALRDGNWDYATNTVVWERTSQTIPDSLYLAEKPAFFGSNTWPWVDPEGATKVWSLPARERYETWFAETQGPRIRFRFKLCCAM